MIQIVPIKPHPKSEMDGICSSVDNEYIPFISLADANYIEKGNNRILLYKLESPLTSESGGYTKKYDSFTKYFSRYYDTVDYWKTFMSKTIMRGKYFCMSGSLLHQLSSGVYEPIMQLCVKKQHLFSLDKDNINSDFLCLVISNDFTSHLMYKQFKKLVIDEYAKQMDIVYTNRIMDICYKTVVITGPKFKTLAEMTGNSELLNGMINGQYAPQSSW